MSQYCSYLNRPRQLALLVLLGYASIATCQLRGQHWDISTFIAAGDKFTDQNTLTSPIAVLPQSDGYDGQFYYRLALDPFTSDVTAFGITLDNPATRGARIVYPLLGWIFSLGQASLLPWTLVALNIAGIFALTWMATSLARANGLPAWLGLAPGLYPGFFVTMVRDTTEIIAATLSFAALYLILRRQAWRAALLAACAVLTRETTLLYFAGFGLAQTVESLRRRRWSWNLIALAIPGLVFVAWQYAVFKHWSMSSFSGTGQRITVPLDGVSTFFATTWTNFGQSAWLTRDFKLHLVNLVTAVMCMAVCGLAAIEVIRGQVSAGLRMSWLLYVALVMSLTTSIWSEPYDYLRAFADCFVISATVIILSRRTAAGIALLVLILPVWLLKLRLA